MTRAVAVSRSRTSRWSAAGCFVKRVLFVRTVMGSGHRRSHRRGAARDYAGCSDRSSALVGEPVSDSMREVGPRRTMPSGGLIAMGNVGNLMRDLRAGLLPLVASQRRFLRRVRGSYDVAVAVGDVYALAMTLRARSSTVFVGTAKSVSVARYGAFENGYSRARKHASCATRRRRRRCAGMACRSSPAPT